MSSPLFKSWTYRELERGADAGRELGSDETPLVSLSRLAEFAPGTLSVDGRLERGEAGDEVRWQGRITALLTGECQRCLEPVEVELDVPLEVRFIADGEADDGVWSLGDGTVALSEVVEEQVLLALPMMANHPDGDCAQLPVGEPEAAAGSDERRRPFAALGALLSGDETN